MQNFLDIGKFCDISPRYIVLRARTLELEDLTSVIENIELQILRYEIHVHRFTVITIVASSHHQKRWLIIIHIVTAAQLSTQGWLMNGSSLHAMLISSITVRPSVFNRCVDGLELLQLNKSCEDLRHTKQDLQ